MVGGASQWSRRVVAVLAKRPVRFAVAGAWLAVAIGGLLVSKDFKNALHNDVPPCKGTPSYDAQAAFDTYFPDQPINGAIFIQSADGSPLVDFAPRSTCRVEHGPVEIADRVISLRIRCGNSSALGGGCATKDDLVAGMEALAADLGVALKGRMSPRDVDRVQTELMVAFMSFQGSMSLPTNCPVPVGSLTPDWLGFMQSLNASLSSKLGSYHNVAESMISMPAPSIHFSSKLPGLSPAEGDWSVNVSADVPAGEFWSISKQHLMTDSLTDSLVATLHSSPEGVKLLPIGNDANAVGKALTEIAEGAPATLRVKAMSLALIGNAMFTGVDRTMGLSAMTVPFALIILAAMVRNLRLALVTVVNLAACYSSAVLIMCPIVKHYSTASTAPALMVAIALAMSIDYSLFLLTRFKDEVASRDVESSVAVMLVTSGRIVLVSGVTLLLCFLMMLCLPIAFIASMGVSAAVTVLMAMLAALTMTPTLLLSFPGFFSSNKRWGFSREGCCCRRDGARHGAPCHPEPSSLLACQTQLDAQSLATLATSADAPLETSARLGESCEKPTRWLRFGACVQRLSWVVMLGLLVVAVPVATFSLPYFRHAIGFVAMMPSDADITQTLHELQAAFGVGAVFPTTVLVVPREGATASPSAMKDWMLEACDSLKVIAATADEGRGPGVPAFTPAAFSGAMILDGQCTELGLGGSGQWSHVGGPYSATKIVISYAVDPFTTEGQQWIQRLRDALNAPSARYVATWYVLGAAPIEMDVANETFHRLPTMIALMMGAVFVVIAASTRSFVAPVRAVLCLTWMLVMTLGLAVFTFQDGMLDALHWPQIGPRSAGAMSWMSPCMAISVLVGLGLDYDIFYSERVVEEWKRGHSEKEAAVRALAATASTISVAGLIMVVAFLALLLCTMPALNEISFMLIVGITIDCLIATKVIIPCMMAILGKANFWPRSQPRGC